MTSISNIWKQLTSILSNLNNFHSLEVVDRVSETQFQVGENSDWKIVAVKGLRWIDGSDNDVISAHAVGNEVFPYRKRCHELLPIGIVFWPISKIILRMIISVMWKLTWFYVARNHVLQAAGHVRFLCPDIIILVEFTVISRHLFAIITLYMVIFKVGISITFMLKLKNAVRGV